MKIPIHIAQKLLLLTKGNTIPNGLARHAVIDELVTEGILERSGRIRKILRLRDQNALEIYLKNKYAISSLDEYIGLSQKEEITRNELVSASSDSKLRKVRTFKGFLINCFSPLMATLDGKPITLRPQPGFFQFIYDYEKFIPSPDITIVGIENPENFRHIDRQKYLFPGLQPLFISRYPQGQSKDMIKWLQAIPNRYLHFGDFDLAGIGIYLHEYKRYLKDRASFFIPENLEESLRTFGNKGRYDKQKINFEWRKVDEENLITLMRLIHQYKKGLDQEILIR